MNPALAEKARGLAIAGPPAFLCLPFRQKSAMLHAIGLEHKQQVTAKRAAQEENS